MLVDGIGVPMVTPFDTEGDVDHDRLQNLVTGLEARDADFLVPCGSTSEAELLTQDERAAVVETVVEAASVPVVAGTGHPGRRETLESTRAAAAAGADAAMVVTPFYYNHDQQTLATYYREVADAADLPIYLYAVPVFTHTRLTPDTVADLADHPNIVGVKDSSGDLGALSRMTDLVPDDFQILVGSVDILASGLAAGADGGILAVANLRPEASAAVASGDGDQNSSESSVRESAADLAALNATVLEHGIPGLKWVMRQGGAPAGYPRSPHQPLDEAAQESLRTPLSLD